MTNVRKEMCIVAHITLEMSMHCVNFCSGSLPPADVVSGTSSPWTFLRGIQVGSPAVASPSVNDVFLLLMSPPAGIVQKFAGGTKVTLPGVCLPEMLPGVRLPRDAPRRTGGVYKARFLGGVYKVCFLTFMWCL